LLKIKWELNYVRKKILLILTSGLSGNLFVAIKTNPAILLKKMMNTDDKKCTFNKSTRILRVTYECCQIWKLKNVEFLCHWDQEHMSSYQRCLLQK